MEKEYSNGEIIIEWHPEQCTHSTQCWRGLPRVFNPRARPWVNPEGATTEQIIAQVEKCPSKALRWRYAEKVAGIQSPTEPG